MTPEQARLSASRRVLVASLFVVPSLAAALAVGCTDDVTVAPVNNDAGGSESSTVEASSPDATAVDAGADGAVSGDD